MNKNVFSVGLIAIAIFSLFISSPTSVSANWLLDRTGSLIKLDSRILGDDDSKEVELENESDDHKNDDQNDDSSGSPNSKELNERQKNEQERINEQRKNAAEEARKASDKAKKELEQKIKINEIKTKTKKIETKSEIEVEGDKLKIKQKIKDANGKETETELELEKGEELQVESQNGDDSKKFKLKVKDGTGQLEIERDGIKAKSNLPISIGENNELIVTRPDGTTKTVTILPDEALNRLKALNITPVVPGGKDDTLEDNMPVLDEEDGQSVYKIDGEKEERVLGLFKVKLNTKAIVSAETGELIRSEQSALDRFISIFSF